eukprot:GHVU01121892.1.p1 GENE.GHVU01121892.1~~GHVU01121892.1.p1  ORF type:complete len:368 (+),score=78.43 GHVU01121892.1:117-1220(+)
MTHGRGGSRGDYGKSRSGMQHHQQQQHSPPTEPSVDLSEFANEWKELEQEDLTSSDYYFSSYAHFGIHEEMLKDSVRTGSYYKAISQNKHLFQDKVVLDVGSGTGILAMFAAQAGARHVYGIECSEIVHVARKIINSNGMGDRITFVQGKAEEVELPVEKVDIIISEWMGYFLLYESMLDTVLYSRDKWLAPNGLLFPDHASLHIAAIEDADYKQEKVNFWDSVYGFNFGVVKRCVMEEPIIDVVDSGAVATSACTVLELDLNTCKKEDLDFASNFSLEMRRNDFLHAFIAWFDVRFNACHKPICFSTGPQHNYTHWKQSVFYMDDVIVGNKGDTLRGAIAVKKSKNNHRELDIKISCNLNGDRSSL